MDGGQPRLNDIAIEEIAREILEAPGRSLRPFTARTPGLSLHDSYRVSDCVSRLRMARGERPVGWKIGFTNRTIWEEYGVHAPIWGPMWHTSVAAVQPGNAASAADCPVRHLQEPRIEPEVFLRIAAIPQAGMDDTELLACVASMGHGIEIVHSVYPDWQFEAADTVAAFALHALYRHGPERELPADVGALSRFTLVLTRDGSEVDIGSAENVLDGGPLTALRHLVAGLAAHPGSLQLRPGDIVTTGTVTRAFPIRTGEIWETRLEGLDLPGLALRFT